MRLLLSLVIMLLGLGVARASSIDALYAGMMASDTGAIETFVEEYYRDAGISVNDTLVWERQRFDEIVNWYNQYTEVIMLSELPLPAQTAAYWQNWSRVLTQEIWDWRSFFRDEAEAALMASFNQFLLAAHEYGHALTFRYDPLHQQRYDDEINCREYLPDRLAAALLEEVAEKDARIGALKARYRELIDEINAHIAPDYRLAAPSFATLDADCRVMHVEQPTDEASMTPYASAFFVRQGLLQAQDLPPLTEVYATHLLPYWRALQPPPAELAGAVTTGDAIVADLTATDGGLKYESRTLAFDPSGALYVIETGEDTSLAPPRIRFSYGRVGAPVEIAIPPRALPYQLGDLDLFAFTSRVALGPDRFVVLSGGGGLGSIPILLFDVSRQNHAWTLRVSNLEPDRDIWTNISQAHLAFDPSGTLYAYLLDPGPETARWRRLRLDPETLAVTETSYLRALSDAIPVAVAANGDTYFAADYQITVMGPDGVIRAFAGARLQGFKDSADPLRAELATSHAQVQPLADGGIVVLDYDPKALTHALRHVAPAQ